MAAMMFLIVSLSGCIILYHWGGAKVFAVKSSVPAATEFVQEYGLKYVCFKTYGLFYADFYRTDCSFAVEVGKDAEGKRSFAPINDALAEELGLEPDFSFWDRFGSWLAVVLLLLVIFLRAAITNSKKTQGQVTPPQNLSNDV